MHKTPLRRSARSAPRGRALTWLRRVMLLGCIAVSLALVGDQAVARTWALAGSAAAPSLGAQTRDSAFGLAVLAVGTAHGSAGSWSDGSIEAVSLLVLGLGLVGAGRFLGRTRQDGLGSSRSETQIQNPREAALRPHLPRLRSISGRSAR